MINDMVTKMVAWWENELGRKNKNKTGNKKNDSFLNARSVFLSPDEMNRFKLVLETRIRQRLEKQSENFNLILEVDYSPKGLLEQVIREAKINPEAFPAKKTMDVLVCFKEDSIIWSINIYGYTKAETYTIYPEKINT